MMQKDLSRAFLILIIFILNAFSSFSQEVISDLWVNSLLREKAIQKQQKENYKTYNKHYYFVVDTLNLPFIDDFSTDKTKLYYADESKSMGDSVYYSYSLNGSFSLASSLDSLAFMLDTTYTFFWNTAIDTVDSTQNAAIQIIFFNDELNPFFPNDTLTVWPTYQIYAVDTLGNISDSVQISADSTIYVEVDTLTMIKDDDSFWVDNDAFINNDYPVNPITVGVATLDGLDNHGQPYDFSDPLAQGIADYLTSKPINLSYQPLDSIYLSFFYEPQGHGNYPEQEDSLVLELFSPVDREWHHAWATEGFDSVVFQQVLVPITDSIYLQKGFQFRFKNYATLSGALDHWHIDYVHLDSARTMYDTTFTDVAFIERAPSMLTEYEAMPWKHFLVDTTAMEDTTHVLAYNYTTSIKNTNYSFQIFENTSTIFSYPGYSDNFNPDTTYNFFGVTDTFVFNSANTDSAVFEIQHIIKTDANDLIKQNDTVRHEQKFYNYYAYDDGTAEVAYGLNVKYGKLAYQFNNKLKDTLRGVEMYFAPVIDDVSEKEFMLTIWDNNNGIPGSIVYQQQATYTPVYLEFRNSFYSYLLDTILVLDTGKFYVGWEQLSNDMLNIGFDRNDDMHKKIFYNVIGSWNQSVQEGCLMMRPMFGDTVTVTSVKAIASNAENIFTIYPNPVVDYLNIKAITTRNYSVKIVDLQGRFVSSYTNSPQAISVANLPRGMYFIQIIEKQSQNIFTQKFIVDK